MGKGIKEVGQYFTRRDLIVSHHVVIANTINNFFVNVSKNITKTIPRTNKSPVEFIGDRIGNSTFIAPSVPLEISEIISLLKTGRSLGPNSIPKGP